MFSPRALLNGTGAPKGIRQFAYMRLVASSIDESFHFVNMDYVWLISYLSVAPIAQPLFEAHDPYDCINASMIIG